MRRKAGLTRAAELNAAQGEFRHVFAKALQHVDADGEPKCKECRDRGIIEVEHQSSAVVHLFATYCPKCDRDVTWDIKLPANKKQVGNATDHRAGSDSQQESAKATISARKTLPLQMDLDQHFTKLQRAAGNRAMDRVMTHHRPHSRKDADDLCDLLTEMQDIGASESDQELAIRSVLRNVDERNGK